ncbi:EI24 domain-containing protein [Nocardiopsis mangrovi]|uniref:EI24 domain-containing protein n=1 Tax=Nocardiopsis mangrovi TaxID=1179818 RepID=A0ABV9DVC2_9ACTN
MSTPVRDAFSGVGILLRGFGMVVRRPKLFFLGAIPPLITSILFLVAFISLLVNIESIVAWMTPFADGWAEGWATTLRVAAGVVLVAATVLIMVVGFTGLTLALGFPLYDKIAEDVEDELGDAPPEIDDPIAASIARAVRQSVTIILITALVTLPMFIAGFIPVVGQTLVPVISAIFGGWMLSMELIGTAFDRRGLRRLGDRRSHMAGHRMLVLGFSVPTYLLLAIPFVAVVVFPAATAGGTILARRLLDSPAGRAGVEGHSTSGALPPPGGQGVPGHPGPLGRPGDPAHPHPGPLGRPGDPGYPAHPHPGHPGTPGYPSQQGYPPPSPPPRS